MSRKKVQIPIEDQITDYFDSAPQHAVETLLRVITRQVQRRFPSTEQTSTKSKANGVVKHAKPQKAALGADLGG